MIHVQAFLPLSTIRRDSSLLFLCISKLLLMLEQKNHALA